MIKLRIWLATCLAFAYEVVRPRSKDEPDFEILRMTYEKCREGGWYTDALVQTEATKALAFMAAQMIGDAPNFVTADFSLTVGHELEVFEITVRRCSGKTPAQRIGELEEELSLLTANEQPTPSV